MSGVVVVECIQFAQKELGAHYERWTMERALDFFLSFLRTWLRRFLKAIQ